MVMNISRSEKTSMETEYRQSKLPARLLSVGQVAHFLGVHPSTVRRWGKRGLLKSYAIGLHNNLRFKQEEVLSFLDKCQQESTHEVSLHGSLDKVRHKIELERR